MEAKYLSALILSILYLLILMGFTLLNLESISLLYYRFRMGKRLAVRKKEYLGSTQREARLSQVLLLAFGRPVPAKAFIAGVFGLFFIMLLTGLRSFSFHGALWSAFIATSIPCMLLYVRQSNVRKKGSNEGEALISEFLRQYRISNYNVFVTMERVLAVKSDLPVTGKLLYRLLLELRNTGDSLKISKATEEFALALNTNWGRMLGSNIDLAAAKGTNVSTSLEDILIQLREARTAAEERKRLNSEAVRMVFIMVPLAYFATMVLSVFYLDLTLQDFLRNQFLTPEGMNLFLYILFLFTGNLVFLSLINGQRFDF